MTKPEIRMTLPEEILWRAYGRLAWWILAFVGGSLRWISLDEFRQEELARSGGPYVLAFWHGRQFPLVYAFRSSQLQVLVSRSRDGELIHRPLACSGIGTVRGSTSRGGAKAYKKLVLLTTQGLVPAFTPDGPRGPAYSVARGVVSLARSTGASILPMISAARPAWHARSWDSFMVPRPFARCAIAFGRPVGPPEDHSSETFHRCQEELEQELNRIMAGADMAVAGRTPPDFELRRFPALGRPPVVLRDSS
jgi:lysophospholipid acyltransferase (LPLAT)-like uncharacterized protein